MEKKHVGAAAVILVLLAGAAWALFSGEDQEFIEAKKKHDELFQNMENMSRDERRAEFESLREETRYFSDEQRRALREGGRQFMMQRVDRLLAMPKDQQRQELDKMIDQMEERRRDREANGDQGPGGRGGPGGGRGDRGGDMSSAERDQRRKERLDRSSPADRGRMDAMKDLVNERREERGLEPINRMRGIGGPRGGGPGGPR